MWSQKREVELQRILWGVKVGREQSPILSAPTALLDFLFPPLQVSLSLFLAAPSCLLTPTGIVLRTRVE